MPFLCFASPRYSFALHVISQHSRSFTIQFVAFPSRCVSTPFHCLSLLCLFNASLCFAFPWLLLAPQGLSSALRFSTIPLPCFASPGLSIPLLCPALLFLIMSFLFFAVALLCQSVPVYAIAYDARYSFALPPITLPLLSNSSQTYLPLPEFLHCPKPRQMP